MPEDQTWADDSHEDVPGLPEDLRLKLLALVAKYQAGEIGGRDDGAALLPEIVYHEDHSAEHPVEGRCLQCAKPIDSHLGAQACAS